MRPPRRLAVLCALTLTGTLAGCSAQDRSAGTLPPLTTPASAPTGATLPASDCASEPREPDELRYDTMAGVDAQLLSLDVYRLPEECGARPALVWVHAGKWTGGDKRTRVEPVATFAAANGLVLIAVNYRLAGDGTGVQWPDPGDDVARALAHVVDNADELGIDPSRLALIGVAEGGHIATMMAADPSLLAAADLARSDVACLAALDVNSFDLVRSTGADDAEMAAVFGDEFSDLQAASPAAVLGQLANDPTAAEAAGDLPDMMIVSRGAIRDRAIDDEFANLARDAGAEVTVVDASTYTAGEVDAAIGDPTDTMVYPALVAFLHECLDA